MVESALILIVAVVLAYALLSRWIAESVLTPPMLFLALGWALSGSIPDVEAHEILHLLAEVTLVVVLFSDAARVNARALLRQHVWPARLLLIGLPLAVVIGTGAGVLILPGIPFWEVAVLAAILAPTDAALGDAVIRNPAVPERVRRSLTAESGLNDGLALPLILFLTCLALGGQHDFVETSWLVFALEQIGIGLAVGAAVGLAGGTLLVWAAADGASEEDTQGIAVLALAAAAYLAADAAGGNGFLAAFVGGLAFGARLGGRCRFAGEFMEGEGQLLVLASFLMIGLALLPHALATIGPAGILMIVVSLFVVRPVAVWLALAGTDATPRTRLFIGWFGPRGLATALFALLVIDMAELESGEALLSIAVVALAMSALLHGASAAPAARRYGGRLQAGAAIATPGREGLAGGEP